MNGGCSLRARPATPGGRRDALKPPRFKMGLAGGLSWVGLGLSPHFQRGYQFLPAPFPPPCVCVGV